MWIIFALHFLVYAPLNVFVFIKAGDKNLDNPDFMWPSVVPRAISQAVVCAYGFYLFFSCFRFILKQKTATLASQGLRMTSWNRFVVFWAILLASMKLLHALISIVIVSV